MRRKLFIALLTAALGLGLSLSAQADVIWTPEDHFFQAHQEECTYINRCFIAAGYDGQVRLYRSPRDGGVRAALENGTEMNISFTWEGDGLTWGFAAAAGREGWVPLDDLVLRYDSQQFIQDHQEELEEYDGSGDHITQGVLYAYPGADRTFGVLEEEREYAPFSRSFQYLYTDGEGRRWSYIDYYMGHRQTWICLDDPLNDQLPGVDLSEQTSLSQQRGAPAVTAREMGMGRTACLAAGLVALLAAVTLVLIRKLYPKRKL